MSAYKCLNELCTSLTNLCDVSTEPDAREKPEPDARAKPEPDARGKPEPNDRAKPEPDVRAKPEPKAKDGVVTRSKARELAKNIQTMMMEDDEAAKSFFNVFSTST
ncbi:unnamed protein product [Cochlearia groenlandica]